jgi:hypothetical protein
MNSAALSGLLAGYGVAVPVGAIAVVLISVSARTSLRIGAAAGLGAATVDGAYALVAVAGGAGLARQARAAAAPLHWAATATLTILAVRIVVIAARSYRSRASTAQPAMSLSTLCAPDRSGRPHCAKPVDRCLLRRARAEPPGVGRLHRHPGRDLRVLRFRRLSELAVPARQRWRAAGAAGEQPMWQAGHSGGVERADYAARPQNPCPLKPRSGCRPAALRAGPASRSWTAGLGTFRPGVLRRPARIGGCRPGRR